MLSVFPEILFLSPLAPLLIRLALAALLAYEGWRQSSTGSSLQIRLCGIGELLLAALLLAGVWTQPVALGTALALAISLGIPRYRILPVSTTLLALTMALSLIVTGAGAFAFDLPL